MLDDNAAVEPYNDEIKDDIICMKRKFNLGDSMTKAATLPKFISYV